jgi:hypothetical protein
MAEWFVAKAAEMANGDRRIVGGTIEVSASPRVGLVCSIRC